jgi:hypothetical protein
LRAETLNVEIERAAYIWKTRNSKLETLNPEPIGVAECSGLGYNFTEWLFIQRSLTPKTAVIKHAFSSFT